ncbi:MAG: iron-containing alcohol dehydrogenase [Lachnospiraceae bacterium]|nr:iron-containing alcohol dehydrogenase [Lachnospiraceae bacterium]
MQNFMYYAPTKVVFGKKSEEQLGKLIKEEGARKVLIHYGGNSAKKSGLLDRICSILSSAGIEYVMLGGVQPNPRLSKVYEGIKLAKESGADFLLAIGGGSVIDSCKAIAAGLKYDGDVWDLYTEKAICRGSAPVGAVLTIAAAGSEMSNGSVITNDANMLKRSFDSDYCQCKFAVMNPEFTYSLPAYQTASGCVDIIMHTLERYFSADSMSFIDSMAETLVRQVIENSRIALKTPSDYDARANIMWAGSLSHNGLTGCGSIGDWAPHMIEHELGGMFDVAHGAGLAAIWGSWARYVKHVKPGRFAQFAVNVMGISKGAGTEEELAWKGISALEDYFREIHMPTNLRELGCQPTDAQIKELAENCCDGNTHTVGHFLALDSGDIANILSAAK